MLWKNNLKLWECVEELGDEIKITFPAYVNNFWHLSGILNQNDFFKLHDDTHFFLSYQLKHHDEMREEECWSGWLYLNRILRGISRWSTTIYTLWLLVSCYHLFFFTLSHSSERAAQFMHVHSLYVYPSISLLFVPLITSKRFIASCWI